MPKLAIDYFEVRSADAQERLLNDTVNAYSEALDLTKNRFRGRRRTEIGCRTSADATRCRTCSGHRYHGAASTV